MVTGCRKVAKTGGICYSSSAELALQSYIHATTQKPSVGRDPGRCSRVAGQPTGCSAFTSSERGPIPSPDHGRSGGPFRKVRARRGDHHAFIRARERYRGEPHGGRQTRPSAGGVRVRQLHQPQQLDDVGPEPAEHHRLLRHSRQQRRWQPGSVRHWLGQLSLLDHEQHGRRRAPTRRARDRFTGPP